METHKKFNSIDDLISYLFDSELLEFEIDPFVDPKTTKFQRLIWLQIIQSEFDEWLQVVKGYTRKRGETFDDFLTKNDMYDFAKWYNAKIQQQIIDKKQRELFEKKRVGLTIEKVSDTETERGSLIAGYLAAVNRVLNCFGFNRQPEDKDVNIVTRPENFITALKAIYYSNDKNKDFYFEAINKEISKAKFHICKENFENNSYGTVWRVIDHALTVVNGYTSELHFKETNNYFTFTDNLQNSGLKDKPKPNQLQTNLTDEQRRDVIDTPKIYKHNPKYENYIHDYLNEIRTSFNLNKKITFGAVCLALHTKKIFNQRVNYNKLVELLAKYWNIEPPKDKHPNKYKKEMSVLINKHEILERKII